MFSFKPPRKVPPTQSSSSPADGYHDHGIRRKDDTFGRTLLNSPFESISGSSSVRSLSSTLVGSFATGFGQSAPVRSSGAGVRYNSRRSHYDSHDQIRHGSSFEDSDDPLRAALNVESMFEDPTPPVHGSGANATIAHSLLDFSRRQVASIKPHHSALSAMATARSPNPFGAAAAAAQAGPSSGTLTIQVYFPHVVQPCGQCLDLTVHSNARVEDVVGLALWTYWEKRWLPEIDAANERDTNVETWIMLVPNKEGVVKKRIAQNKMSKFNFDKYAIVRAPRSISESVLSSRRLS
ncbi:hypothetical protein C8J57DRAFT_1365795 [Mycena rebaudengoi]|nr:hypothetical protein C8J57DRAFT_1365795 [Mycena rebaudengoi]